MAAVRGRPFGWIATAAVAAACGANPAPVVMPAPPPLAQIEIAAADCPLAGAEPRLRAVLAAHRAEHADLAIRVHGAPNAAGDGHDLHLVVVRGTGAVGLDRRYALAAADCASATELVALGVDRFLSAFPEWAEPPRPAAPPPPPPLRWRDVHLAAAVSSIWVPVGVDGQVGAIVDWGGDRDRIGGTLIARASVPQAVANGHFQQTSVLAGVAWRRRDGRWSVRAEARAGALLVSGIGFTRNDRDWLPWWEGAVFAGRAMGWGALGVEVAATGLRHRAVTGDGLVAEDIPLFRLGISAELRLGTQKR
jgi:hypothetical protein